MTSRHMNEALLHGRMGRCTLLIVLERLLGWRPVTPDQADQRSEEGEQPKERQSAALLEGPHDDRLNRANTSNNPASVPHDAWYETASEDDREPVETNGEEGTGKSPAESVQEGEQRIAKGWAERV